MTTRELGHNVHLTTLPNGLMVATDTMPEAYSVALGVYVNAGTRNEDPAHQGVSHMLEHMAFKGTINRTAHEIAVDMDAVGGHMNAYTTRETTAYYTKVLPKAVPLATEILGDILQNSVFMVDEIQKEKSVIIQEIGQTQDSPDDLIFDIFQETAYPDQPMGWSILGSVDAVNSITREAILDYMEQHYAAENLIVAAAGNIEHQEFLDIVEKHFGSYNSKVAIATQHAHYQGGIKRISKQLEQVHFILGFEGAHSIAEDFYTQSLYSTILGGGMSSRLFQTIREKHGLAYTIYSFTSPYQDTGLFGVYAGTGAREVNSLMPLLLDELLKSTDSLTEIEIERAKEQLVANICMGRESTSKRVEQLAQNIQLFARHFTTDEIEAEIRAVTKNDVEALASKIVGSTPTLTAIGAVDEMEHFSTIVKALK